MTQAQFLNDIQAIDLEVRDRQAELNGFYTMLQEPHAKAEASVDAFLKLLGMPKNEETTMAALTRMVHLREDALEQVLVRLGFDDKQIRVKKELAYGFVSMMHIARHESLIGWMEQQKLLTPFYRALIFGVHFVGVRLSEWQSRWSAHILHTVNLELSALFGGDDAKVFEMLHANGLLDRDAEGNTADRSYSVLVKDASRYRSAAYAEAFEDEVASVVMALDQLLLLLDQHDDDVYGQKHEWIAYFTALRVAFSHTVVEELVGKWAEVDRRWMAITTPIQVGHPLEYYEDHYRKAVALEWDVRIINPRRQAQASVRNGIKLFAHDMAQKLGKDAEKVMQKNLLQVDQAQLYIGQPMLYYAAEFNGLFSAQVVPNDTQVSGELGKKIFAYADFVLEGKKSKPIMALSIETMGEPFVRAQRALTVSHPDLWYRLYDLTTIGHEFGHILWIDRETETAMNRSGQFKNIEEFKATAGGLMAFFRHEDAAMTKHLMDDLVARAVGLIAWQEVGEVLPYYCEGLIHLDILFASGAVRYGRSIVIDYDRYGAMRDRYVAAYTALARHYVAQKDAGTYLARYAVKVGSVYLPVREEVRAFVTHYYARYQAIGQQVYDGTIAPIAWRLPDADG